ncbi:unnamed protein product [Phyllotreta striolata]|uniref:Craniofacial development protein 1 n=1 Tax=Phyllotreta striolata TaxID=444603 RepID=A0A9N9XMC8_PHYSR|nr:unnamed protein product [Phyllotreta striolata]
MNIEDLPDESDSSDEDYKPDEKVDEVPSEIDEDDPISEDESNEKSKKTRKTKKKGKNSKPATGSKGNEPPTNTSNENKDDDDKKSNVDDLWADFVKDTGFKSKNLSKSSSTEPDSAKPKQTTTTSINPPKTTEPTKKQPDKVKVTQIFEFAGEEVRVEKEVPVHSAEARLLGETQPSNSDNRRKRSSTGLSGIGNVLSQLTKKSKISTLEKTKLDWDRYKKDNDIAEELETHNKGKDGFLERQDFLERTDLRRFEIERSVREVERNKRFNSTL